MISGFITTVKQDINRVYHLTPKSQAEEKQLQHSYIRLFATLGMTLSTLSALSALKADSLSGALVAGIATALSHDIFVISVNDEKTIGNKLGAGVRSLVDFAIDRFKGKETVLAHPCTEGTLLRPLWDQLIQRKLSKEF